MAKPAQNKDHDEGELEPGPDIVIGAAKFHASQMDERSDPRHRQPEQERPVDRNAEEVMRQARRCGVEIRTEGHRRECDRHRKADHHQQPAGNEAECGMINAAQEIVPVRHLTRKHRCQARRSRTLRKSPRDRRRSKQQERETGFYVADLKSQAGVKPRRRPCRQRQLPSPSATKRCRRTRPQMWNRS